MKEKVFTRHSNHGKETLCRICKKQIVVDDKFVIICITRTMKPKNNFGKYAHKTCMVEY